MRREDVMADMKVTGPVEFTVKGIELRSDGAYLFGYDALFNKLIVPIEKCQPVNAEFNTADGI